MVGWVDGVGSKVTKARQKLQDGWIGCLPRWVSYLGWLLCRCHWIHGTFQIPRIRFSPNCPCRRKLQGKRSIGPDHPFVKKWFPDKVLHPLRWTRNLDYRWGNRCSCWMPIQLDRSSRHSLGLRRGCPKIDSVLPLHRILKKPRIWKDRCWGILCELGQDSLFATKECL